MAYVVGQGRMNATGDFNASNAVTLITGGTNGTKVTRVRAFGDSSSASAPFSIRLFITQGATTRCYGWWLAAKLVLQYGQYGRPDSGTYEINLELSGNPLVIPSAAVLKANLSSLGTGITNVDASAEGVDL